MAQGQNLRVKMRTPMGVYYSDIRSISGGLPLGGVLSPLFWMAFFKPIPGLLRQGRRQQESGTAGSTDLI